MGVLFKLLLSLLTLTSLQAEGIDQESLGDIYTEAIWFVAVFALMSIISFVVSRKHAKEYAQKNPSPKQSSPEKPDEPAEEISANPTDTGKNEIDRLTELSKMLKDGLLSEEEFQILSKSMKR